VQKFELPSQSRSSMFMIGRDSRGNWVVRNQRGTCGGLFVDRVEALRFALFENGNDPQAVIMVPGVFELNMSGGAIAPHFLPRKAAPQKLRVA
jgi:hypothetical protein